MPLAASAAGPLGADIGVLFAHGFGQTRQAWTRSMLALGQAGIASAAYDLRGHGQSGRNAADERYDVEQFIDDALAVRSTLAPLGMRAAVGTPMVTFEPAASSVTPVAVSAPCAKA